MDYLQDLLKTPFSLGLLLGLASTLVVAASSWIKRRSLVKDNSLLREHLHTHMTISAKGSQATLQELEQLKKQNENMRISLATLKNRPDKSELRTLYLYNKAIHLMYAKAPGFAPAWELIIAEAEIEMEKTSTGLIAWARKVIHPSLIGSSRLSMTESQSNAEFNAAESREKSDQNAGGNGYHTREKSYSDQR